MDLRPQRFPTLRTCAVFGVNARISALIRSSCSTTSADCNAFRALSVRSSGSPGPAPTRNTLPNMADSLSEVLVCCGDRRWDLVGRSVQEPPALFRIHRSRKQLSSNSSEALEPARINWRQLSLEFAAEALCQCGALPCCGDRNLQVSTTNNRWVVEVATVWNVHDVAEGAPGLRLLIHNIVHRC